MEHTDDIRCQREDLRRWNKTQDRWRYLDQLGNLAMMEQYRREDLCVGVDRKIVNIVAILIIDEILDALESCR